MHFPSHIAHTFEPSLLSIVTLSLNVTFYTHPNDSLIRCLVHQLHRPAAAESIRYKVALGEAGGSEAERRPRHNDGLRGTQVHHQSQGRAHLPGHHRAADRVPQQEVRHQRPARPHELKLFTVLIF